MQVKTKRSKRKLCLYDTVLCPLSSHYLYSKKNPKHSELKGLSINVKVQKCITLIASKYLQCINSDCVSPSR